MKRRNVQLAFVGEGVSEDEDAVQGLVEGDEAVDIEVTGGKLLIVVPAGTPDEQLFEAPSTLGGELLLENGLRFSFEIKDGAEGAQFTATPAGMQRDDHDGLTSLRNVPGGA